ncbi:MAG: hypothetical protein OXJ62_06375, partial [Spirochaetaceae bacterium]|nr:hypothetical protein [Spirochaetaceae bacterium]
NPAGPRGTAASPDAAARTVPDRLQPRHGVPRRDTAGEGTAEAIAALDAAGDAEAAAPAPPASSTTRRTE